MALKHRFRNTRTAISYRFWYVSTYLTQLATGAAGGTPPVTPPVNTVLPAITGTPTVGETLSVSDGTWTDALSFAYQWLADAVDISGATANTFELTATEEGALISCRVTATNTGGSTSATSAETAAVEPVAPVYDTDAQAYFTAMTVEPDATRKGHVDTLVLALKSAGIWAKLDYLGLHAAHTEQAALLNAVNPSHTAVNTGTTFITDEGFERTGNETENRKLTLGDRTTFGPTNFQQTSGISGVRCLTAAMPLNCQPWGFATGNHYVTSASSANIWDPRMMSGAQSNVHDVGAGHSAMMAVNRPSSTTGNFFKGTTKTFEDTTYTAPSNPAGDFTVFHNRFATVGSVGFANFKCGVTFVGAGLSDTEWGDFVTAIDAYLTSVGAI